MWISFTSGASFMCDTPGEQPPCLRERASDTCMSESEFGL